MEIDHEIIIELDDDDDDEECINTNTVDQYPCMMKYTGSFDELFKTYNHYATINDSEDTKRMVYYGCVPQVPLMDQNNYGRIWGKSIELVIHHIDDQYFVGYSSSFPWFADIKSQFQKLFTKIMGMIEKSGGGQSNIATHRTATAFTNLINQLKQYQKRYGLTFHVTPIGNK
jgi:hypothetical protein